MKHFAKRIREKDYLSSVDDLVAHVRILNLVNISLESLAEGMADLKAKTER